MLTGRPPAGGRYPRPVDGQASRLARINNPPWIANQLAAVFDFDITDTQDGPVEPIRLASAEAMDTIARDAAGGMYFLCGQRGEERPVPYTDAEGGAALLARSLAAGLVTIIQFPYWKELLVRSEGGDVEKMRAALPDLEREVVADEPDLDHHRARLLTPSRCPSPMACCRSTRPRRRQVPDTPSSTSGVTPTSCWPTPGDVPGRIPLHDTPNADSTADRPPALFTIDSVS